MSVEVFALQFRELDFAGTVLKQFLACAAVGDGSEFVWEDHYRLKRLSNGYGYVDVAPKFGKSTKGVKRPKKVSTEVGGRTREVQSRDITHPRPVQINTGYDVQFQWVNKVKRQMYD